MVTLAVPDPVNCVVLPIQVDNVPEIVHKQGVTLMVTSCEYSQPNSSIAVKVYVKGPVLENGPTVISLFSWVPIHVPGVGHTSDPGSVTLTEVVVWLTGTAGPVSECDHKVVLKSGVTVSKE